MFFNNDIINDSYTIQEASIKSVEDAERKLRQLKNGSDNDFWAWFKWVFKIAFIPIIWVGPIPVPIFHLLIDAYGHWMAKPGSAGDKLRKCDKLIKKTEKAIAKCKDSNTDHAKKCIKDYEKFLDKLQKDREKYAARCDELGNSRSNWHESMNIIDNYCTTACMYETYYEDYISTTIANEAILTRELQSFLPINESSYNDIVAINESRFRDIIKANCNRFMEFINNLAGKFLESMTKILLNENKKYLEKYKDIILNKRPKDLEATFTGDYYLSTTRCQNMMIPIFNYKDYGSLLLQDDGMEAIITKLMSGKTGFSYNKDKDMAESFKSYFIAGEKGEHKKKFKELDFKEMYNFCYNFKEINNIVNKDKKYLKQSTDAVVKAITDELNKLDQENRDNNPNKDATTRTDTKTVNDTNTDNKKDDESAKTPEELQNKSGTENANASFIFPKSYMSYIRETNDKDDHDSTKTNLSIDGVSSYGSYDDPDTSSASSSAKSLKDAGKTEADLNKIAMKWMEICRKLLGAKFNALEQIAKNYMAIIRAHVRSYIGNEDDKTTDRKDNKEEQENNENDNK